MSATSTSQPGVTSAGTPDVWLFYSLLTQNREMVLDALAALYYLPENFKLLIAGDTEKLPETSAYMGMGLTGRVQYQGSRGSDAIPSAFEMALYDEAGSKSVNEGPAVVITKTAKKDLEQTSKNHYTVPAGRPDAIASAALTIARAASYKLVT